MEGRECAAGKRVSHIGRCVHPQQMASWRKGESECMKTLDEHQHQHCCLAITIPVELICHNNTGRSLKQVLLRVLLLQSLDSCAWISSCFNHHHWKDACQLKDLNLTSISHLFCMVFAPKRVASPSLWFERKEQHVIINMTSTCCDAKHACVKNKHQLSLLSLSHCSWVGCPKHHCWKRWSNTGQEHMQGHKCWFLHWTFPSFAFQQFQLHMPPLMPVQKVELC